MEDYEVNVIAGVGAVLIIGCVFALVMELLRLKPGCCWLSPHDLEAQDEKTSIILEKVKPEHQLPLTPCLKQDTRISPEKRIKSATSAAIFYAYNRSTSARTCKEQKHKIMRAKTAGHIRTNTSRNGFHGILFSNEPICKRKVSFSPKEQRIDIENTDDENLDIKDMNEKENYYEEEREEEEKEEMENNDEIEQFGEKEMTTFVPSDSGRESEFVDDFTENDDYDDDIPEDTTSTVSLESKEEEKPICHSIAVDTRISDMDMGTQCDSPLAVTYADGFTQTDCTEFDDSVGVIRAVRLNQGSQVTEISCVEYMDTSCGPSIAAYLDQWVVPEKEPPVLKEPSPVPPLEPEAPKSRSKRKEPAKRQGSKPGSSRSKIKPPPSKSGSRSPSRGGRPRLKSASYGGPMHHMKTHPILKPKGRTPPFRALKGKPPKEKWQIAAERVYLQKQQALHKPGHSDKTVLGLKTAVSEIKNYTLPPAAVYEVTRGIMLIIGEKPEDMKTWPKICQALGKYGPLNPVTRLVNLKTDTLTIEQRDEGRRVLNTYSRTEVSRTSKGASVLYNWLSNLVTQADAYAQMT